MKLWPSQKPVQKNIIKNAPYLRLLLREPQRIFHSDPQKTIDGKSWYFSCYLIFCFISGFSITFCLYNLLLLLRIKQTKKLLGRKKKKDPTYGWMDGSVQQHPSSLQPSELKRNPCDLLLLILSSGEYLMPCVWWFFFYHTTWVLDVLIILRVVVLYALSLPMVCICPYKNQTLTLIVPVPTSSNSTRNVAGIFLSLSLGLS